MNKTKKALMMAIKASSDIDKITTAVEGGLDERPTKTAITTDINTAKSSAIITSNNYTDEKISETVSTQNGINTVTANQISALGSGSPAGVYATSADLLADSKANTTKTYVVSNDGKWYYYNGTTWTAGGVYQATAIADNYITSDKLYGDLVETGEIENVSILANVTITASTGISATGTAANETSILSDKPTLKTRTASLATSQYASMSDYIHVNAGDAFTFAYVYHNVPFIVVCDTSKAVKNALFVYVSDSTAANTPVSNVSITFPTECYIRIPVYKLNDSQATAFDVTKTVPACRKKIDVLIDSVNIVDGSIELLEKTTWSDGSVDSKTGNIVASNYACKTSDFISVSNADGSFKYKGLTLSNVPASATYLALYNANKSITTVLKGDATATQNVSIKLPDGTAYIRVCWYSKMCPDGIRLYSTPRTVCNNIEISEKNLQSGYALKKYKPYQSTVRFTVNVNKALPVNSGNESASDKVEVYTDNAVLFLPMNYSVTGKPTRLIISCHGSGTTIDDTFVASSKSWNKFFIDMGYAVLDVNGCVADGRHYGASFAIQSYIKAYQHVIDNYNIYSDVFVVGASMGGLPSMGLINSNRIPVLSYGAFEPVTDLYRQAYCSPWYGGTSGTDFGTQRKSIAECYGFTGTEPVWSKGKTPTASEKQYFLDNIDKVSGHNPILYHTMGITSDLYSDTDSIADSAYDKLIKFSNVPIKIWHCDDDPTVNPKYSKKLIDAIVRGGGIAQLRTFKTGGHACMTSGENVTLNNLYDVPFAAPAAQVEMLYWLQRWE